MEWKELEVYHATRMEEAVIEETIAVIVAVSVAVAVVAVRRWPRAWRRHTMALGLRSVNLKIIVILVVSCLGS